MPSPAKFVGCPHLFRRMCTPSLAPSPVHPMLSPIACPLAAQPPFHTLHAGDTFSYAGAQAPGNVQPTHAVCLLSPFPPATLSYPVMLFLGARLLSTVVCVLSVLIVSHLMLQGLRCVLPCMLPLLPACLRVTLFPPMSCRYVPAFYFRLVCLPSRPGEGVPTYLSSLCMHADGCSAHVAQPITCLPVCAAAQIHGAAGPPLCPYA